MPMLMAAGVALTISNTRAVFEAIIGVQTAFARTPKYAIEGSQKMKLQTTRYRSRSGWLPYMELAIGTYFLFMMAYAVDTYNFLALPFLVILSPVITGPDARVCGRIYKAGCGGAGNADWNSDGLLLRACSML
jgi:hypothetical protein